MKLVLSLLFAALVAFVFAAFSHADDTVRVFDGTAIRDVPFAEYLDQLVPRAKPPVTADAAACGTADASASASAAPTGRRVLFPRLRGRFGR